MVSDFVDWTGDMEAQKVVQPDRLYKLKPDFYHSDFPKRHEAVRKCHLAPALIVIV